MRVKLTCYKYILKADYRSYNKELHPGLSREFDDMSEALLYMYKVQKEYSSNPERMYYFTVDLVFDVKER